MPKTRSGAKHFILGTAGPLPKTKLPTKGDVINYLKFLDQERNGFSSTRKTPADSVFHEVGIAVSKMWSDEGIPIHDIQYVKGRVRTEYKAFRKVNKTKKSRRDGAENDRFKRLFDIAKCKCTSRVKCGCPWNSKIPQEEWAFVKDQRHKRYLSLGSYDRVTSEARLARLQRRESRHHQQHHGDGEDPAQPSDITFSSTSGDDDSIAGGTTSGRKETLFSSSTTTDNGGGATGDGAAFSGGGTLTSVNREGTDSRSEGDIRDNSVDKDKDVDFNPSPVVLAAKNFDCLRETALAADRFGVSNRAAAGIINAYQVDIGRVTSEDMSSVVDAKKIWRARNEIRSESAREAAEVALARGVESLYFDGRKDKTSTDFTAATEIEEHVVVLSEPGGQYLTHFTPQSGAALHLLNELHNVAIMFGGNIKVLGCDGKAVNTGTSGGACRLFELVTGSAVHWFVCMLHGNELNLRHVFKTLDGTTSGPRSFTGAIGTSCAKDVWNKAVVAFEPVPGHVPEMPTELVTSLSHDQQLLYRLARAVQSGSVPETVARQRIGPLNHAR